MTIEDRWFRIPETSDDPIEGSPPPDIPDSVIGWSGQKFRESPRYVCRVYAESDVLDGIANQSGVNTLDNENVIQLMADMAHVEDIESERDLNRYFRVGT